MSEVTLGLTFVPMECCSCGVPFALTKDYSDKCLRDRNRYFCCPNGHSQHYLWKSDLEVARENARFWRDRAERRGEELRATEKQLSATKGVVTRLKNRVGRGVCPCCNRTFRDLAAHMGSKHPGYAEPSDA